MTRIADILRNRRKKRNMTLLKIARNLGVTQTFVHRIENGKANLPLKKVVVLSLTIGINKKILYMAARDDALDKVNRKFEQYLR